MNDALPGVSALFAALGRLREACVVRCGALRIRRQSGHDFWPIEVGLITKAGEKIDEAVAAGALSKEEVEQLERESEAMTIEELTQYALKALSELDISASA